MTQWWVNFKTGEKARGPGLGPDWGRWTDSPGLPLTPEEIARERAIRFTIKLFLVLSVVCGSCLVIAKWLLSYDVPTKRNGVLVYDANKLSAYAYVHNFEKSPFYIIGNAQIQGSTLKNVAIICRSSLTIPGSVVSSEIACTNTLEVGDVRDSRLGAAKLIVDGSMTDTLVHAGSLTNHGPVGSGNTVSVGGKYAKP